MKYCIYNDIIDTYRYNLLFNLCGASCPASLQHAAGHSHARFFVDPHSSTSIHPKVFFW